MLFIGADHRGFRLKEKLKLFLEEQGIEFQDLGNHKLEPKDDYPDFAARVAEKVSQNPQDRGVLLCGSGAGAAITADKFPNIRAALGFDPRQVKMARSDDDVNVLALAADFVSGPQAKEILKVFLETPFSYQERHQRRLEKIKQIEGRLQ
jgi:ribose 5-phosphate isomerase B